MILAALALNASLAAASTDDRGLAARLCGVLSRHIDDAGGGGLTPLFLKSYEPGPDETALPAPLATSAFAYDNALAIIALASCGDVARSRRIADAFVAAVEHDRTFADGRVRNAYRAGLLEPGPAKLPGWWDSNQNLWAEDPYQDGTQTGNVAWVALALLTLDQVTSTKHYQPTAEALATWIADHAADGRTPGGFSGGVDGYDPAQTQLMWRSSEHNVDVNALGTWLQRVGAKDLGARLVASSRRFLDAMFDPAAGMFRLGTTPDGTYQPEKRLALDALTWPIVGVVGAPSSWRRSLTYAWSHLAVPGGFDFNGDRDGLWTEGTAQAAFIQGFVGDAAGRQAGLGTISRLSGRSGYLYATGAGRITTGIAIGPQSKGEDFFYYHRPHLGATAWAVLAATGFNPFTGAKAP